MGVLGSLGTCSQSISFCKPRELICLQNCGKINQTCVTTLAGATPVTYFDNTHTTIAPNGFLDINNEGTCTMYVSVTDATGTYTNAYTVDPGQTKKIGVAGLKSFGVICVRSTSSTTGHCIGEWAFQGSYEASPFAY